MVSNKSPIRWRFNWPAWLLLVVVPVIGGVGLSWLHDRQLERIADRIRQRAERCEQEAASAHDRKDRTALTEALAGVVRNYDLYLRYRPTDGEVAIRLALAVSEQAENSPSHAQLQLNAYRVLSRTLARFPENRELLRAFGKVAMRLGRWSEALSAWSQLRQIEPDSAEALLNVARCQVARAQPLEAIKTLRDCLTRHPDALEAYTLLARCYRDEMVRDYESARQVMDELVAKNPDSAAAYARRAAFWLWVAQTTANPQEASDALSMAKHDAHVAMSKDSLNVEALLIESELVLRENRLAQAHELLQKAAAIAPDDERVWSGLVKWARLAGDVATQEKYLQRLAERNATFLPELVEVCLGKNPPDILGARSVIQQMQKAQFDAEALELWQLRVAVFEGRARESTRPLDELFRKFLDKNDSRAEIAGLTLVLAYTQSGASDAAGAVLGELRVRFPESSRVQLAWINWLLSQGMTEEAQEAITRLMQSGATSPWTAFPELQMAYFLATLNTRTGLKPQDPLWKQLDDLRRSLESSPALSPEQKTLLNARWLQAQGEVDQAVKLLEEAIQERASLTLWTALCELLGRSGRISDAIDRLSVAEKQFGPRPEILLAKVQLSQYAEKDQRNEILADVVSKAKGLRPSARQTVLRAVLRLALQSRDLDRSAEIARQLAVIDPNDTEIHRLLLEFAVARANWEDADRILEQIRRAEGGPGRVTAYGRAVIDVGRASQPSLSVAERERLLADARSQITMAGRYLPFWPDLIRLEARIAQLEGRWEAAIESLRSLEQRGLLGPQGREELARLLLLVGQTSEAERVLQSTAEQTGNNDLQRLKLQAEIWAQQGQFERVKQVLGPRIEESSDPLDWLWWAQLLSRSGNTDEADRAFERAKQLAPHVPQIILAQIIYLVRTNRNLEARKQLEELGAVLKKDAPSLRVLALGYEAVGDIQQAEQCFRRAMDEAPQDADLLLDWAGFSLRQGRLRECQAALERIVAASGNNLVVSEETLRNARRNLAQLLAKSADYRDFQRARSLLEENLKQAAQITDRCLLARVLANRPERTAKQEVADIYQKLLREGVILSAEDRFVYAQILAVLGRWPDARLQMAALFQQTPDPTPAQLAFFIREMLTHGSPGEEIQPYLEKLVARLGDDSPAVLELKTRLAVQSGNTKEIESRWRDMVSKAIDERKYDQAMQFAELAEKAGMTSLAGEVLEQVTSHYPVALMAKALFLSRQQKLEAALDCCEQALAHVPVERVVVCAVNCLRAAREQVKPDHLARVDAWFQRANVNSAGDKGVILAYTSFLNLAGRYEELVPLYRRLLSDSRLSDLEKALLENNLAYVLGAQCDLPSREGSAQSENAAILREAEQLVEHAITVLGPIGSFLDTRAVVRMRQERLAEAISDARQAVLEEPSALTYFHLVEALWLAGDKATAVREFQRARDNYRLSEEALPPIERPRLRRLTAELKNLGLSLN